MMSFFIFKINFHNSLQIFSLFHYKGAYLQQVCAHGRRTRVFVSYAGRAEAAAGGSCHRPTDSCSEGKRSKCHKQSLEEMALLFSVVLM